MAITPALPSSFFNAIPTGQSYVDGVINQYVLHTKAVNGIGGFVFDYLGEESLAMESDITDHFVENNTTVQDHVARKPIRVTMRGFVSELAVPAPQGVVGLLASLQSGLTQIDAYLGSYTPGMVQIISKAITQAQNVVNNVETTLAKVQNVVMLFPGAPPPVTIQERVYLQLLSLWLNNVPVAVETPYSTIPNMMIERVSMIQPDDTKGWSDISVTLKQLRFVEIESVADTGQFAARRAQQAQSATNKGVTPGSPVPQSLAVTAAKAAGFL
jgi:hypothetical protein